MSSGISQPGLAGQRTQQKAVEERTVSGLPSANAKGRAGRQSFSSPTGPPSGRGRCLTFASWIFSRFKGPLVATSITSSVRKRCEPVGLHFHLLNELSQHSEAQFLQLQSECFSVD